jgi:outer membrane protein assembly factor BamB
MLFGILLLGFSSLGVSASPECFWGQYGNDPGHSFAQSAECSSITPVTVNTLVPKWLVRTGSPVTASPAVADGTVYVGANNGTFYAVDAETGAVKWTYEVDDRNNIYVGLVSSPAVPKISGKRVVLFGRGGTLYMLDGSNGNVLARACIDPRLPTATRCAGSQGHIQIESSPSFVWVDSQPWVVVGLDVHDDRDVGRTGVVALRIDVPVGTGAWGMTPLWKFDPENHQTYTGPDLLWTGAGTGTGCAGSWSSPSVDVDGDMVFFGTGSCSIGSLEDGPWSGESLYGVHLRTGEFRWQYNPRIDRGQSTRLDDDFGASTNLLPFGRVGDGSKDGWYYGLNRDRPDVSAIGPGEWASHAGQAGHAGGDFAIGGMIGSAAVGDAGKRPAIFATTAISTPLNDGSDGLDKTLLEDPGRLFSLHAIDAENGKILWRSPLSRQSYGAPTYANGLVFVPSTVAFSLLVFHADTGALLRILPLNGAPSSAPAIVGNSIYMGTGTTQEGIPIEKLSGIWAFHTLL